MNLKDLTPSSIIRIAVAIGVGALIIMQVLQSGNQSDPEKLQKITDALTTMQQKVTTELDANEKDLKAVDAEVKSVDAEVKTVEGAISPSPHPSPSPSPR
jgi:peptidoglycan hydrolase CwlO-like protein